MSLQQAIRLLVSVTVVAAALSGCATTPPEEHGMPQLLQARGLAEADATRLATSLQGISFPGKLSLAALSQPAPDALTRPPSNSSAPCVLGMAPPPAADWEALVGDMQATGVLTKSLPLDETQRQEALQLLASGQFIGDVQDTLEAVFRIDPALADAILRDVLKDPLQGLDLLPALRNDADGSIACANQYLDHVKQGDLRKPSAVCRPRVLTQTLQAVFATPGGAAVSDTARAFVRKDNRTIRLAILAYARANGINLTEANLDQLERALDREHPDLYPLLAGAVDTLAKEYGVQDLDAKLRELGQRDKACRARSPIAHVSG